MNIKLNTICFIILLFLVVGVASAADSDNETFTQTIEQPDDEICQMSSDSQDELMASNENNEKLEKSNLIENTLEAKINDTPKLEASKSKAVYTLTVAKTTSKTKVTLKAPNVKMYYNDGSKLVITLKDKSKKAIAKAMVKIYIFDKIYTKSTDSKGKTSLSLHLNPGTYAATIKYDGSKKHYGQLARSTITVKSTIKPKGLTKFYTNNAPHYSTFYDKKGKLLKNTAVKFKLNGKTYSVKTNKKGVAKLAVDLKPGNHIIESINPKTSETAASLITVKSILETRDLVMSENDGSKFTVKVLNSYGKVSPNKKVILNVNGKTYTPISDSKGIAAQVIDLPAGKYSITTEYAGLKNTNQITVEKSLTHSKFSHVSLIPDYVNVTVPHVFSNSKYAVKTGADGIIKLPKHETFAIHISATEFHVFSTTPLPYANSTILDQKTYLIPFDENGVKSDYNKDNLKGDGILISRIADYTQIEYRSTTLIDADLFGLTYDKHDEGVEIITYIQNDLIKARILFFTQRFDELGLKTNLGKLYNKNTYEINFNDYDKLTNNNADKIKFTSTNKTVQYNNLKTSILPVVSHEDIITKLIVNGVEELEKTETMTYGLGDRYQVMRGFEILQSYAIINDKITHPSLEKWLRVSSAYLTRIGIMNIYGMFLASLETAWIADELADQYARELNVKWSREKTATILGGINLDDTYIHILNADMGMEVIGDNQNSKMFKMLNSFYLPNIENYVLNPVAENYKNNTTNSIDNIFDSIENNKFSITQIGEMFYIIDENNGNSTIVINSTTGIANVIYIDDEFAYKGSVVSTSCDCCSASLIPAEIIKGVENTYNKMKHAAGDIAGNVLNKIHPLSVLGYMSGNLAAGIAGKLVGGSVTLGLASTVGLIMGIHGVGNYVKNNFVDKKDWHWAYEHVTFTRNGYMQNKKFFNIPKSDGKYDYIEVGINSDGSLNRNDAVYVGEGYTKKLSKSETYNYFNEEKWTSCSIPRKYQKYEVPLIFG
nr:hypothetical protein [uncultured Methanobrevibacter sp.]